MFYLLVCIYTDKKTLKKILMWWCFISVNFHRETALDHFSINFSENEFLSRAGHWNSSFRVYAMSMTFLDYWLLGYGEWRIYEVDNIFLLTAASCTAAHWFFHLQLSLATSAWPHILLPFLCGGAAHVLKWDPFTPRIWKGICLLMLIIVTKIVHKAVLSMLILQRHSQDTCSGLDC